jgi:DNA-binding transcriptional MerR regulator
MRKTLKSSMAANIIASDLQPKLRIGDLAKQTNVSVGGLRYYEVLGLLKPLQRGENGYRYYAFESIRQVLFIKKAQVLGFSLAEIRRLLELEQGGQSPCELVKELLDQKITYLATQIDQMNLFKTELEAYQQQWKETALSQDSREEICPLISSIPLSS